MKKNNVIRVITFIIMVILIIMCSINLLKKNEINLKETDDKFYNVELVDDDYKDGILPINNADSNSNLNK